MMAVRGELGALKLLKQHVIPSVHSFLVYLLSIYSDSDFHVRSTTRVSISGLASDGKVGLLASRRAKQHM